MLETGGRFRFLAKSSQVRRARKMSEADHLQRDGAIQTFLSRAINDALPAASDFFEQLVIAKVHHRRSAAIDRRKIDIVIDERAKRGLEHASAAKSLLAKKFGAAFSAGSHYNGTHGRSAVRAPIIYCSKFAHKLLPQYRNQMSQFVFNVAGKGNRVRNLFAQ